MAVGFEQKRLKQSGADAGIRQNANGFTATRCAVPYIRQNSWDRPKGCHCERPKGARNPCICESIHGFFRGASLRVRTTCLTYSTNLWDTILVIGDKRFPELPSSGYRKTQGPGITPGPFLSGLPWSSHEAVAVGPSTYFEPAPADLVSPKLRLNSLMAFNRPIFSRSLSLIGALSNQSEACSILSYG